MIKIWGKGALEFEIPSWVEIEDYIVDLARRISPIKQTLNAIVCIWRGGAYPSRLLSDYLSINTIYNLRVQCYDDIKKRKESPLITQPISTDLTGKNVLVCDDVSDSGNTLGVVKDYLEKQQHASPKTATLYIKPWTKFIPDYYIKSTDLWIVFPWERIETIEKLVEKKINEGKALEDIKGELLSAGFERKQVEYYISNRAYLHPP